MRCLSCHRLSVSAICSTCETRFLVPDISRRQVGTLEVVSFFKYSTIEPFLLHKHTPPGHRIYHHFGRQFIHPFLSAFADQAHGWFSLIGIDEQVRHGYAHTAVLTRAVHHPRIHVLHGKLLARNRVQYAGKTLQYRLEHPRDFEYTGEKDLDVVLVDDVITTGVTLQEAQNRLQQAKVNVLFALTLANAQY
jgi:competence protein ComFC